MSSSKSSDNCKARQATTAILVVQCAITRESAQPSWVLVDSTMLLRHRGMTHHLCSVTPIWHLLILDWSWKLFCFSDWFGTLLRVPSRQTSVSWHVWNVCLLLLLLLLLLHLLGSKNNCTRSIVTSYVYCWCTPCNIYTVKYARK